jgi:hypothetical protein
VCRGGGEHEEHVSFEAWPHGGGDDGDGCVFGGRGATALPFSLCLSCRPRFPLPFFLVSPPTCFLARSSCAHGDPGFSSTLYQSLWFINIFILTSDQILNSRSQVTVLQPRNATYY